MGNLRDIRWYYNGGKFILEKFSLFLSLFIIENTFRSVYIALSFKTFYLLLYLLPIFTYLFIIYLFCFYINFSREEIMQRDGNFSVELGEKFREREDNLPFLRFISFSRLVFLIRSYKNIYNIII